MRSEIVPVEKVRASRPRRDRGAPWCCGTSCSAAPGACTTQL